jgi:hypothetical protein
MNVTAAAITASFVAALAAGSLPVLQPQKAAADTPGVIALGLFERNNQQTNAWGP